MKNIIVAGYGSSGSSAIVDYLFDSGQITGFWMDYPSETRFLNYQIIKIFREYLISVGNCEFNIHDFIYILTAGSVNSEKVSIPELIKKIVDEFLIRPELPTHRKRIISEISMFEYIVNRPSRNHLELLDENIVEEIIVDYSGLTININNLERIHADIVNMLVNKCNLMCGKKILFNNDAHLWNNDSKLDLDGFNKVLVFRNPIDQYARKNYIYAELDRNFYFATRKIFSFAYGYNKSILYSLNLLRIKKLVLVQYENFLMDKNTRNRLNNYLGINRINSVADKKFNIEYSLKQIGNNNNLSSIEKLVLIITTMPIYCIAKFYRF